MKRILLVLAAIATIAVTALLVQPPGATATGNNNPTCADFGLDKLVKIDPPNDGTYSGVTVDFWGNGTFVNFDSTVGIDGVIVKGGFLGAKFYAYDEALSDDNLHTPTLQQISHVTFCVDEDPTPTPTNTATATATPTDTATPTPTDTPEPTATNTLEPTVTFTPTATPTDGCCDERPTRTPTNTPVPLTATPTDVVVSDATTTPVSEVFITLPDTGTGTESEDENNFALVIVLGFIFGSLGAFLMTVFFGGRN